MELKVGDMIELINSGNTAPFIKTLVRKHGIGPFTIAITKEKGRIVVDAGEGYHHCIIYADEYKLYNTSPIYRKLLEAVRWITLNI